MKHILDDSHGSHFWSTFWSPIDACYIPFQSSGSQQSNASNGAQFGVETKKLQPLQVKHSKLKKAFCKSVAKSPFCCEVVSQPFCIVGCISFWRCPIYAASWEPQDGSQLCSPAKIACCCEMISQPFLSACEISQTSFSLAKWSVVLPDVCYRHWEIFSIRFLLSKSQNTPCKPPITRFLSF